MAKSKRDQVILACSECGEHNYITTRNKKTHPNKMEIKKFCSRCKKETLHTETKK
ncbi:MAG: 50S ribosomal protein L33 [Mollicutes bacterium]|nr:50S ribosomal protein L33 [Mollicutes bacterium]MDD7043025.1 50S ribosomal protein L33 [Mollicutes bacterium]MDY6070547.1 50S ribosomal protein L33 [Bacilli bacterium]